LVGFNSLVSSWRFDAEKCADLNGFHVGDLVQPTETDLVAAVRILYSNNAPTFGALAHRTIDAVLPDAETPKAVREAALNFFQDLGVVKEVSE